MRNSIKWITAAGFAALVAGNARADELDISSLVNANLSGYYNGSVYPANGGPVTIGGVNFNLASYPGGGTGVIQSANGNPDTYTISVGQADVSTVYTVINSAFGIYGSTIGALTFTGTGGATYTYNLTEGDNVRDHATTSYNTLAPNVYATEDFGGGDRLDVQQIILPSAFDTQTLESITFTATDNGGGDPFLAAVDTVTTTPLPSTWSMMFIGIAGLGIAVHRRKRSKDMGAGGFAHL